MFASCRSASPYRRSLPAMLLAATLLITQTRAQVSPGEPPLRDRPDDLTPAEAPSAPGQELDSITGPPTPAPAPDPLGGLSQSLKVLKAQTGLELAFAYTTVFAQATPGDGAGVSRRRGATGDIDLLLRWNAVGRGTDNPGTLVFAGEYRHQIGSRPAADISSIAGLGVPAIDGFTERPVIIKDLYWIQHLFDGVLRLGAGRAGVDGFVGSHKFQSANTFFLSKAFSGNASMAFPGNGMTAAAGLRPNEDWYVSGGLANAYGRATTAEIESFFTEGDFFSFFEAGWTPTLPTLGQGRYRVALWRYDERDRGPTVLPDDQGVNLIIDQALSERLSAFLRVGWADGDLTGITHTGQIGAAFAGLLDAQGLTGLAASIARFARSDRRDESTVELFHRFQLTPRSQLTLSTQAVANPADQPADDLIGVLAVRFRIAF